MGEYLASSVSKMVHAGEADNLEVLEGINQDMREHLVRLMLWIVDLLLLKAINYDWLYRNRRTGKIEFVPWSAESTKT